MESDVTWAGPVRNRLLLRRWHRWVRRSLAVRWLSHSREREVQEVNEREGMQNETRTHATHATRGFQFWKSKMSKTTLGTFIFHIFTGPRPFFEYSGYRSPLYHSPELRDTVVSNFGSTMSPGLVAASLPSFGCGLPRPALSRVKPSPPLVALKKRPQTTNAEGFSHSLWERGVERRRLYIHDAAGQRKGR